MLPWYTALASNAACPLAPEFSPEAAACSSKFFFAMALWAAALFIAAR